MSAVSGATLEAVDPRLVEKALRACESRLRALGSAMREAMVILDGQGAIVDVNAAAEALFGLTRTQLLGRGCRDPLWQAIADDGAPWPADLHPALITLRCGQPQRDQLMGIVVAQQRRWINMNVSPVWSAETPLPSAAVATLVDVSDQHNERHAAAPAAAPATATAPSTAPATALTPGDGLSRFLMNRGALHDITELQRSREQLRRIALEQQAMLDNDLIGIVKLQQRIAVWQNRAMSRIFGYGLDELLGLPSRVLYASDADYEALGTQAYPAMASGGHFRTQLSMVRKDGGGLWIDMSGVLLSAAGDESIWFMVDLTAQRQYQERIERMAHLDGLTGLPNRVLLADRMTQALALAQRQGYQTAVCYVDLDGFKGINDQLGHAAGDQLLVDVARRLPSLLRAHDTACRLGGDEFVLLLTQLSSVEEVTAIVQRVLAEIRKPVALGDRVGQVSASIGVALAPQAGADPKHLLQRADAAMYLAKQRGRNQVCMVEAS